MANRPTDSSSKFEQLPTPLRDLIDRGEENCFKSRFNSRSVVGAIRIAPPSLSSARAVAAAALESDLVVVNLDSDGCVLLGNYLPTANWPLAIMRLLERLSAPALVRSAVQIGFSMGPAQISLTEDRRVRLNSVETRLAWDLAGSSPPGTMAVTSKIWHALADAVVGWNTKKGLQPVLENKIALPVVRVESRLTDRHCPKCRATFDVRQDDSGYIVPVCMNGHPVQDYPSYRKLERAG